MELLLLLADGQTDPNKAIGWLERLIQGGVPLICLAIALIAGIAWVYQFRKNSALELEYREDLAERAEEAHKETERRLTAQREESEKHASKSEALMRERLQAEKESDATLAHAVRVIEANTKALERLERKLEG